MSQRLSTQLQEHGCNLASVEFKQLLAKTKTTLFPDFSEERLACSDKEIVTYGDEICRLVGVGLPLSFIRFQLLGTHKSKGRTSRG